MAEQKYNPNTQPEPTPSVDNQFMKIKKKELTEMVQDIVKDEKTFINYKYAEQMVR